MKRRRNDMKKEKEKNILNMFTQLPYLLDMLHTQKITFTNPDKWIDKNDFYTLGKFRQIKGQDNIFCLCFSYCRETIYHWAAFADGISGVCMEFNYDSLIKEVKKEVEKVGDKFFEGRCKYVPINKDDNNSCNQKEIYLLKRYPYRNEKEHRFVVLNNNKNNGKDIYQVEINLKNCIKKITFNQDLPHNCFESIKVLLEKEYPYLNGKINHSTILDNKEWKRKIDSIIQ
jgi:hypothetical protein